MASCNNIIMDSLEIIRLIERGFETSTVQFKRNIDHINQIVQEIVAFANTLGGYLIIGVSDTGEVIGLHADTIRKLNQWVANASTELIKPPVSPLTEVINIMGKDVLVVEVPKGANLPYYTNEGIAYIKKGSDKRIAPPEEILRMFQRSNRFYADESVVQGATTNDIETDVLKEFLYNKYRRRMVGGAIPYEEYKMLSVEDALERIGGGSSLSKILQNMSFSDGTNLTLAGLMLFGKNPQKFKPLFTVQCVCYIGNHISGSHYRDSEQPFEGNLKTLFDKSLAFLIRNLRNIQVEKSFNTLGELEIPQESLEELLVNALVHRDYFIQSSVKVLMFDDRIEIVSPGKIPNSLTIQNMLNGQSIARNPILHSNSQFLLPYKGLGSGIPRAISAYPEIVLHNYDDRDLFVAEIKRKI